MTRLIDLSHIIADGMETYPGLPRPIVADHLTREAAEQAYGPGITFQIKKRREVSGKKRGTSFKERLVVVQIIEQQGDRSEKANHFYQ